MWSGGGGGRRVPVIMPHYGNQQVSFTHPGLIFYTCTFSLGFCTQFCGVASMGILIFPSSVAVPQEMTVLPKMKQGRTDKTDPFLSWPAGLWLGDMIKVRTKHPSLWSTQYACPGTMSPEVHGAGGILRFISLSPFAFFCLFTIHEPHHGVRVLLP